MSSSGVLLVVAATSGTGKSTVCSRLLERDPSLRLSISYTSRAPRAGEVDGVDYRFVERREFESLIKDGLLLEWAEVHGNLYGTPAVETQALLDGGHDVLFDIDVQGALQLRESHQDAVLVFLLPPSWEEAVRRLRSRGTETEEKIARRLETAVSELAAAEGFDYLVVNDELEEAVDLLLAVRDAERSRARRCLVRLTRIRDELSRG